MSKEMVLGYSRAPASVLGLAPETNLQRSACLPSAMTWEEQYFLGKLGKQEACHLVEALG